MIELKGMLPSLFLVTFRNGKQVQNIRYQMITAPNVDESGAGIVGSESLVETAVISLDKTETEYFTVTEYEEKFYLREPDNNVAVLDTAQEVIDKIKEY